MQRQRALFLASLAAAGRPIPEAEQREEEVGQPQRRRRGRPPSNKMEPASAAQEQDSNESPLPHPRRLWQAAPTSTSVTADVQMGVSGRRVKVANGVSEEDIAAGTPEPQHQSDGRDHITLAECKAEDSAAAGPLPSSADVEGARALLAALSRYRPQAGPSERRWQLSRACPYDAERYRAAAAAAAASPGAVLGGLGPQQLAYAAAGYATAQLPGEPALVARLLMAIGDAIVDRMAEWARRTAAAPGDALTADLGDGGRSLTLRSAAAAAAAFARLGVRHVALFTTISAWLKVTGLRGEVFPLFFPLT